MHAVQGMRCCHGRLAPTVPGQASRFSPVLGSATLCQPKRRPCRRFSPCKLACTQSGHDRAFNVAPICREGGFVHAGCADAWEEGGRGAGGAHDHSFQACRDPSPAARMQAHHSSCPDVVTIQSDQRCMGALVTVRSGRAPALHGCRADAAASWGARRRPLAQAGLMKSLADLLN